MDRCFLLLCRVPMLFEWPLTRLCTAAPSPYPPAARLLLLARRRERPARLRLLLRVPRSVLPRLPRCSSSTIWSRWRTRRSWTKPWVSLPPCAVVWMAGGGGVCVDGWGCLCGWVDGCVSGGVQAALQCSAGRKTHVAPPPTSTPVPATSSRRSAGCPDVLLTQRGMSRNK